MKRVFFILLFGIVLFQQACKPPEDEYVEPEPDVQLTLEDWEMYPYVENATFKMYHNKAGEMQFYESDHIIGSDFYSPYHHSNEVTTFEYQWFEYSAKFPEISFSLNLRKQYVLGTFRELEDTVTMLEVHTGNSRFKLFSDLNVMDSTCILYKEVSLGNRTFNDVIESTDSTAVWRSQNENSYILPWKIWFSKEYGVLKVFYTNDDSIIIQ